MMKPSTRKSYQDRIDRVIGYLSEQVDSSPSLASMADIAAISPFHFHRVYRAMTGETPSMTLRRLRLVKACHLLKSTDKPITEVAFDVLYDSSQSFARAFRAATNYSPSEIRNKPSALDRAIEALSVPAGKPRLDQGGIEIKISSLEPFKVVAARHLGPHQGLFESYGKFFAFAEKAGWIESFKGIYGIPIDDPRETEEDQCRFDCCFEFGPDVEPDAPYRDESLGGGLFAVLRHIGHYDGLDEKYNYLYGSWLESSGYWLRSAPLYNHYVQDPDSVPPEEWETDIYLPIQEANDI